MKESGSDGSVSGDPNGDSLFEQMNRTGVKAIVGTGRSGKTATIYWLFENCFQKRQKVLFKVPDTMQKYLPDDYGIIQNIEEIEKGDVVFVDDAALMVSARAWDTRHNKRFTSALTIISHWDVVMIIAIQNMRLLDILAGAMQDFVLLQKFGEWENITLERREYKNKLLIGQAVLQKELRRMRELKPNLEVKNYMLNHKNWKLYKTGLPSFWVPELSVPYADYRFNGMNGIGTENGTGGSKNG